MNRRSQNLTLDPDLIQNLEIQKMGSEFRASLVDDENYALVNGYGIDLNEAFNDLLRNLI